MSHPEHENPRVALWYLLERSRESMLKAMLERVAAIPVLAPLVSQLGTPEAEARNQRGEALTRGALVDGDVQPYLDDLREQGRNYARMGMTLPDWYSLIDVYRVVLVPLVVTEYHGDPARLTQMLLTVDGFVDRAMREIGAAYLDESERLVRNAEGERDLWVRLFESSPLGFGMWRAAGDGTFTGVSANPALLRMRGISAGRDPRTDLLSVFYERATQCLATGEGPEWTVTLTDGTAFRIWLVRLDGNHVGQIVENITAIRRSTRQLERSISELERSNRDLDQFAYVASHDLKAPLRDIDNLSRWLVEDLGPALPEASGKHITRLRDRVGRMERLLDDLLQYSRAGRVIGPTQRFDLLQAVESAVAMVAVPADFTIDAPSGSLVVDSPRAPFEVVLRNLIGNALKHHDQPAGKVVVRWAAIGPRVELTVEDDGPGIPPEYHDRVFAMFQTLKPRDQVEGSGMGLAIVRKVVEAFDGTIHVRAGTSRGATFVFTWPRHPGDHEEQPA